MRDSGGMEVSPPVNHSLVASEEERATLGDEFGNDSVGVRGVNGLQIYADDVFKVVFKVSRCLKKNHISHEFYYLVICLNINLTTCCICHANTSKDR